MDRVVAARESRKGTSVVYMELITKNRRLHNTNIFCCFEGDDYKYYSIRIDFHSGYKRENIIPFTCGGKSEVLKLQKLVEESVDLKDAKVLFFIDRDFDEPIDDLTAEKVFETSCYAIENYYTSYDAFSSILKGEFGYNDLHEDYETILELYKNGQAEFHKQTLLLNAWLACQRDIYNKAGGTRLNLTDSLSTRLLGRVDLDSVQCNYDIETLHSLFPDAVRIPEADLQEKIKKFDSCCKVDIFRGKFEIYFLYWFIEGLLAELRSPSSRFKKQPGMQLRVSRKNLISELSQYAMTPVGLIEYLNGQWQKDVLVAA